jgi:beta-lactam-binding protein with PASTA domain
VNQKEQQVVEANPATAISQLPTPACTVPSLHGLSLHGAKARLRADHCLIGQVRLAPGATRDKGKVVKQFHPAGATLATGASVPVKLGSA